MATLSPSGAGPTPDDSPLIPADSSLLHGVEVTLQARLGQLVLPVSELMDLRNGAILALETRLNEPIDLLLNDTLIARGEIVAVDDCFGVRIVEIAAK
jgi:flagellar motor switch protein FliN/FliY